MHPVRTLLDGLTAVHRNTGNQGRARDEVRYPLVGIHPETGRRGLFYSAHHVQDFVELSSEGDVDEEIRGWLAEAWLASPA